MPRNSTSYKLAGTDTFRLASSKILGYWGTNLQNPTRDICKLYIPDEGRVFIQVDQSGAEALIVAYLCRPGKFRDLFLNGVKPHVFVGLHLFKDIWRAEMGEDLGDYFLAGPADLVKLPKFKELDKLIKSSDNWPSARRFYYMAKQVCHSSNYDIQAPEFAVNVLKNSEGTIRLDVLTASKFLATYHTLFPEIREWHQEVQRQLKMSKTLKNLFGYTRKFYAPLDARLFKKAYAWIPQSTVGCITSIAITTFQDFIEANGKRWDILNNKHDSYLTQCPIGEEAEVAKEMQKHIELDLMNFRGERFKMRSEAQTGYSWGELH